MSALVRLRYREAGAIRFRGVSIITTQLSLASEERAAKVIAMLERLRRDDPTLPTVGTTKRMSEPADLETALGKDGAG
jgi:hypothetical protein